MNRRALVWLVVIVGGSAVACKSPLSPLELVELNAAEARWAARAFQSYAIETISSCFCSPVVTQWARVEVERVFSAIRAAQHDDWVKDVVAEFDPQLGFPTSVSFVPKDGILDGGRLHSMRNATALP